MRGVTSAAGRARRRRRSSLQSRLVGFTAPILLIAVTATMMLAIPVWVLPERLEEVEVRLERALEAHTFGAVVTEQGKHYLEYLYVDQSQRAQVRREIEVVRGNGDELVRGAPAEIQRMWSEFHVSGESLVQFVDAEHLGAGQLASLSLVPAGDALGKATRSYAGEAQAQAQQALDRIKGVWSLLPSQAGGLSDSLERVSAASHKALEATHAKHAAADFVAAYPALLAGAGEHPGESAAAAAVETEKALRRLAGDPAERTGSQADAARLAQVLTQLREDGRTVAARASAGDRVGATEHFNQVLHRRAHAEFFPGLADLVAVHRGELASATKEARSEVWLLQVVMLTANGVFVAVVLGAGLRLLRGVAVPMRDLQRAHRRLAHGDTTTRIPASAAGPLGDLATSFNVLAEELATGSSARLAKAVLDHTEDVLLVVDAGVVRWASPAADQLSGGSVGVVGRPVDSLVACGSLPDLDGTRGTAQLAGLLRCDGSTGQYELTWVDLRLDPQVGAHLLLARDVTARATQQAALAHRAAHDVLTGLPNRTRAVDVLDSLAEQRRGVAMLFCDVDNFKDVNDSLGHAAGDTLLEEIAERLRAIVRDLPEALVARLGGDEFVLILPDQDAEQGAALARSVALALRIPFVIERVAQSVCCSIGLSAARAGGPWDPAALLREADLAMYKAKRDGRGEVQLFSADLHDELVERLRLDRALATDVEGCVRVHYQPIVGAADGRPVGVEALLRWQDGDLALPPDVVVARAEATRTISALGLQVLTVAARQVAQWRAGVAPGLCLSVNASVVELERPTYTDDVLTTLAAAGLPPSTLTIEVTESAFSFEDRTLLENLRGLRAAGVSLSIDDFGTGWSSLSRLGLVSPAEIKIDRSFVTPLAPESDVALVRAVLAVSRELGCCVVAEGVEREEQRSVLAALGVDLMQGYLFGRPVPAAETERLLARSSVLSRLPRQGSAAGVTGAARTAAQH
jgi:diguanylate cyclase (GGDEF)-like protein